MRRKVEICNQTAEALKVELACAYERIAELEEALGGNLLTPPDWRLSAKEMRLFGVMLARVVVSKDAAMAALYRDFAADEPNDKIIGVFVWKLRRKLEPIGIVIQTVWGLGYRLTADSKARARALIEAASMEIAA